jgi:hypothetical protein
MSSRHILETKLAILGCSHLDPDLTLEQLQRLYRDKLREASEPMNNHKFYIKLIVSSIMLFFTWIGYRIVVFILGI